MSAEPGHAHPPSQPGLPPVAWPVVGAAAAIVAAAWGVTLTTTSNFASLLAAQAGGGSPADALAFVALSGVMMVAMMLPSALPMAEAYRGIVELDEGRREALVRAALFSLAYLVVWTAMTALSLPILVTVGVMGSMAGAAALAPGAVLVVAGLYQFTSWKDSCLRHCRSPIDFLSTHYRKGRAGALGMGLSHARYCLGCCWLLMLVWFVAGAMSLLWMGVFAAFILAEKVWSRGGALSRAMGAAAVAAGAVAVLLAAAAPPPM